MPRTEEALEFDAVRLALVLAAMDCCRFEPEVLLEPVSKVVKLFIAVDVLVWFSAVSALAPCWCLPFLACMEMAMAWALFKSPFCKAVPICEKGEFGLLTLDAPACALESAVESFVIAL